MVPSSAGADDLTASPTRSRHRLHNFTFPTLRWGKGPVTVPAVSRQKPHRSAEEDSQSAEAVRSPWNLRTRRFQSSCNETTPVPLEARNSMEDNSPSPGKSVVNFSVSLSREEIEDDFLKMKGMKPQRRPNKRPRIVQRKLDRLFPGLWLYEITADSY